MKKKFWDKVGGYLMLVLLSCFFIGVVAATTNIILYRTTGVEDSISKWEIKKVSEDEFILSYIYANKITQKEYIVERSINADQYDKIKDKPSFKIRYVGYFPGSPHIERVDSKDYLLIMLIMLVLVPFAIRRNILFLKGKIGTQEFT